MQVKDVRAMLDNKVKRYSDKAEASYMSGNINTALYFDDVVKSLLDKLASISHLTDSEYIV